MYQRPREMSDSTFLNISRLSLIPPAIPHRSWIVQCPRRVPGPTNLALIIDKHPSQADPDPLGEGSFLLLSNKENKKQLWKFSANYTCQEYMNFQTRIGIRWKFPNCSKWVVWVHNVYQICIKFSAINVVLCWDFAFSPQFPLNSIMV